MKPLLLIKTCQNLPDCGHGKEKLIVIAVAGCGMHYFVSAVLVHFELLQISLQVLFTAMKIHTMARIVKKKPLKMMCFSSTVGYGIIVQESLFKDTLRAYFC